jgi:HEAT repeat protein
MRTARIAFALPIVSVALAGRVPAQEHAGEPSEHKATLQRAVNELTDDDRHLDAVRTLIRHGESAVAELRQAIRDPRVRADAKRLAAMFYAVGRIGEPARPLAPLLVGEAAGAPDEVARSIFWALGEIGPGDEPATHELPWWSALLAMRPNPGASHQEWMFACRRIELGRAASKQQLRDLLQAQDHATLAAAAALVRQRAHDLDRDTRTALRDAWRQVREGWAQHGTSWARVTRELGRALAAAEPDTPDAVLALCDLVDHFDVDVRLDAVMRLGQVRHAFVDAVDALVKATADGSVHVRREAVTALGMLGTKAAAAAAVLGQLVDDPDAQVRRRAAAALRAVECKAEAKGTEADDK